MKFLRARILTRIEERSLKEVLKYLNGIVYQNRVKNKRAWDERKRNFKTREGMEVQRLYFARNKNGFLFKTVSFFKMLILNYLNFSPGIPQEYKISFHEKLLSYSEEGGEKINNENQYSSL